MQKLLEYDKYCYLCHETLKYISMKRQILLIVVAILCGMVRTMASSYDFSAVCSTGQTLYYNIIDASNHEVELTYPGNVYYEPWAGFTQPSGDLVLPESVTYGDETFLVSTIGDYAFSQCRELTSVTIPLSVTVIGEGAFNSCQGMALTDIPNSVTSIGGKAFASCSGIIGDLIIPNSVTSLGVRAFAGRGA